MTGFHHQLGGHGERMTDPNDQVAVPNETCTMCGGTGARNDLAECPLCHGTGVIDASLPDGS